MRQNGVCKGRWTVLGQSFGGFCALTYLSFAPHGAFRMKGGDLYMPTCAQPLVLMCINCPTTGLYEVMLTGGIPPGIDMPCSADTAYRALYKRVLTQNAKFYKRFPGDVALVQRIVQVLHAHPEGGPTTPCGNRLSVRYACVNKTLAHIHDCIMIHKHLLHLPCHHACFRRMFLTLGLGGLGGFGGFERLHYLLERAFDGQPPEHATQISYSFLKVHAHGIALLSTGAL